MAENGLFGGGSKKGASLAVNVVITVVIAVLVLGIILFFVSEGFRNALPFTQKDTVSSVKSICSFSCNSRQDYAYCFTGRQVFVEGSAIRVDGRDPTCEQLANIRNENFLVDPSNPNTYDLIEARGLGFESCSNFRCTENLRDDDIYNVRAECQELCSVVGSNTNYCLLPKPTTMNGKNIKIFGRDPDCFSLSRIDRYPRSERYGVSVQPRDDVLLDKIMDEGVGVTRCGLANRDSCQRVISFDRITNLGDFEKNCKKACRNRDEDAFNEDESYIYLGVNTFQINGEDELTCSDLVNGYADLQLVAMDPEIGAAKFSVIAGIGVRGIGGGYASYAGLKNTQDRFIEGATESSGLSAGYFSRTTVQDALRSQGFSHISCDSIDNKKK